MRNLSDPPQRQPEPPRVLEHVDGRVVGHRQEALLVHLQDLVTYLWARARQAGK